MKELRNLRHTFGRDFPCDGGGRNSVKPAFQPGFQKLVSEDMAVDADSRLLTRVDPRIVTQPSHCPHFPNSIATPRLGLFPLPLPHCFHPNHNAHNRHGFSTQQSRRLIT